MTVSSFYYDERGHHAVEVEMYFNINRAARGRTDIRRIQDELRLKGRKHFRYWVLKHLNVQLQRPIYDNFEKELRAKEQVEQARASVRRLLMRRVNKRWEAQELPSGTMRFAQWRRKHGRT